MLSNIMGGAYAKVRMGRDPLSGRIDQRRGGNATGYYPAAEAAAAAVSYTSPPQPPQLPQPHFIYQTSPDASTATASPQFHPNTTTAAYFDAVSPKSTPAAAAALVKVPTAHPTASMAVKTTKNSVQVMLLL